LGGLKVLAHQGSIGRQVTDSRVDLRERYAQLHTSRVMDYSYLRTRGLLAKLRGWRNR
jgi:hypothetical protein